MTVIGLSRSPVASFCDTPREHFFQPRMPGIRLCGPRVDNITHIEYNGEKLAIKSKQIINAKHVIIPILKDELRESIGNPSILNALKKLEGEQCLPTQPLLILVSPSSLSDDPQALKIPGEPHGLTERADQVYSFIKPKIMFIISIIKMPFVFLSIVIKHLIIEPYQICRVVSGIMKRI
jgi:hypothetical protein